MTKAELKAIQVMWLLKLSYGFVLIVAGFDKMPFMHKIAAWETYLSPALMKTLTLQPSFLVMMGGIVEMIIGALILIKTRIGAWVAIAWLVVIILNFFSTGKHFDIIVRDVLLIVGLLSLIWLNSAQKDIA